MHKRKDHISISYYIHIKECLPFMKFIKCRFFLLFLALVLSILVFFYYYVEPSSKTRIKITSSGSLSPFLHSTRIPFSKQGDIVRYKHTKRQLPKCIIIGVRKGGTRAVLEFMDLHPQVQVSHKEIHFFDNDENYSMGLEWYRKKMPYSFPEQITIEKTPAYFVSEDAPARIYRLNSSMKLVLIVREPTERTISDYAQILENKIRKNKSYTRFETLAINKDNGKIRRQFAAIQRSLYYKFMERWLQYFSLNQMLIIDSNDLINYPVKVVFDIESFLGLKHEITAKNFYFNKTRGFYCMQYLTTRNCLSKSKGRAHPQVDPLVIKRLRSFFKPFNQRFFKLVKRVFDWS